MEPDLEQLCSNADVLTDTAQRAAFLREHPELFKPDIIVRLAEAVRTAVRVDLSKASKLADVAVAVASELHTEESLGLAFRAKANTAWFTGDCRSAVDLFDRAATLLSHAGNMSEVGRTLSSSIQSRALLGDYESAYEAANRAREIFRELGEKSRAARLDINVANILHRQHRYSEALQAYERAYYELLPSKDAEAIGVALHNIAVCLIALDDYVAAHAVHNRLRDVCEQNGMPLLAAQANYNIAYLYSLRGEYSKSLDLLRASRETFRKNGDNYHLALCELDASQNYLELNLIQEAAESGISSLEQFKKLEMNYELVRSQMNLAVALSLQGKAEQGLALFEEARKMAQREQNETLPALIDLYSATVLFERAQFKEAQRWSAHALPAFESAGLSSKHVACLLLLGRIHHTAGDQLQAAHECDCALEILNQLDSPMLHYQAEFLRGQILESCGDREEAYVRYQAARSKLETLRSSLQGDELRIGFMRNRVGVYTRLIQLCLDQSKQETDEEAFSYIEAAKSRTLRDLILARSQPRSATLETDENDSRIRDLRKTLNWYYHLIEREQESAERIPAERLKTLRAQATSCERELHRVLSDSQNSGRIGAALQTSSTAQLSEIRKALGNDAVLLEYFSIEGKIYAAVVCSDDLQIRCLGDATTVARTLRMVEFQISKCRLDPAYVSRFETTLIKSIEKHLYTLYRALVEPLEHLLTARTLVVVPYGPLHSLPFHVLFDGRQYLIDRFDVCHAPSASIFAYGSGKPALKETDTSLILGVADRRLPSVRREIEAVAAAVPNPKVLWGAEATEEALREYGATSSLIHVASHGYFRSDSPMFSAIRLADSYLTLHDLYGMNLPAELLTLSGCVTGLNVVDEGDELIGLSRGLLYAGARSMLLSLWDVDDWSTAEFMRTFYTAFASSSMRLNAAKCAMLRVRDLRPHPYYWAGFKLIGSALT